MPWPAQLWADSTGGLSGADARRAFRRAIGEGRQQPGRPDAPAAGPTMSPKQRLAELYRRLDTLRPARTAQEAIEQIASTLDQVEDEDSGVARDPNPGLKWDGRMYPPREDFITRHDDGSLTARTRGNVIDTTAGGAIRITTRDGAEVYRKRGGGDG
ncbi:MAG: hypothetical protein ACT4RN_17555 [Pseudonocardia sp.]